MPAVCKKNILAFATVLLLMYFRAVSHKKLVKSITFIHSDFCLSFLQLSINEKRNNSRNRDDRNCKPDTSRKDADTETTRYAVCSHCARQIECKSTEKDVHLVKISTIELQI